MRDPLYQELNVGGVMLQVSEVMADNDADVSEQVGRMRREEREIMLTEAAENEKLLDKDWRDVWLKRYQDDFDESDMKGGHMSTATTPTTTSVTGKGKEPEKA